MQRYLKQNLEWESTHNYSMIHAVQISPDVSAAEKGHFISESLKEYRGETKKKISEEIMATNFPKSMKK